MIVCIYNIYIAINIIAHANIYACLTFDDEIVGTPMDSYFFNLSSIGIRFFVAILPPVL